jgi:hypothetical protein
VTVLHFGALNDRSTFTPTTRSQLFLATACLEGLVVVNEVLSLALSMLAVAGDVLTQQQQ